MILLADFQASACKFIKHVLHLIYLNNFLQLFKYLAKTYVEKLIFLQIFGLLAELFVNGGPKNLTTYEMKIYVTIVHRCKL